MSVNNKHKETLLGFLKDYSDCYVIIGGIATSFILDKYGLHSRVTKDFDIVLITSIGNNNFSNAISDMIMSGEYKHSYSNNKKNAYRFIAPKNENYPQEIEFFAEDNNLPHSIDRRFEKLEIEIDEDKISAIVLEKELYEFVCRHRIVDDGLSIIDRDALIVTKVLAFYKNKELYENNRKVDESDYKKHRADIIDLLSTYSRDDNHKIEDLPSTLIEYILAFYKELLSSSSKQIAKTKRVPIDDLIAIYDNVFISNH